MVTSGVPVHPFRVLTSLQTHHPKPLPRPPTTHPPIERTITMKILYEEKFLRETFQEGHFARKGFCERFREKNLTLLKRTLWPFNGFEEWIDWLILQIRWIKIDRHCVQTNVIASELEYPLLTNSNLCRTRGVFFVVPPWQTLFWTMTCAQSSRTPRVHFKGEMCDG